MQNRNGYNNMGEFLSDIFEKGFQMGEGQNFIRSHGESHRHKMPFEENDFGFPPLFSNQNPWKDSKPEDVLKGIFNTIGIKEEDINGLKDIAKQFEKMQDEVEKAMSHHEKKRENDSSNFDKKGKNHSESVSYGETNSSRNSNSMNIKIKENVGHSESVSTSHGTSSNASYGTSYPKFDNNTSPIKTVLYKIFNGDKEKAKEVYKSIPVDKQEQMLSVTWDVTRKIYYDTMEGLVKKYLKNQQENKKKNPFDNYIQLKDKGEAMKAMMDGKKVSSNDLIEQDDAGYFYFNKDNNFAFFFHSNKENKDTMVNLNMFEKETWYVQK